MEKKGKQPKTDIIKANMATVLAYFLRIGFLLLTHLLFLIFHLYSS